MNKFRRASLQEAVGLLTRASGLIEMTSEQEQDAIDNLPENLQDSERAMRMEDAVEYLQEAEEKLDVASEMIGQAITLVGKASA
jgi:hypothetical protein